MKCVVAGYGSRGDVEPCIAVAAELQRRGHEVNLAVTVPPDLAAYVASTGLVATPYGRHWQNLLTDSDFTGMLHNPLNAIPQAIDYVNQTLTEKTTTLMSLSEDADLIVAGLTEHDAAANIAQRQHIPLAVLNFFPAQVLRGGPAQAGVTTQANRAQRRALGLPEDIDNSVIQPMQIQAYDKICLPRLADEWSGDGRRPFVGALTLELPTDADDDVLAWITAGAPPIYFGFGSMPVPASAGMIAVIGAACAHVGARALICLGPNDVSGITYPGHVKVVGAVNHATVFPCCRAVVHHGGAGTTAAGLRAGMPSLVLWNGLDQPLWAAVVTHLGVGFGRRFSESTLDSLTADLRAIVAPQYRARASEVAAQMPTAAQSLSAAVDLLEASANPNR